MTGKTRRFLTLGFLIALTAVAGPARAGGVTGWAARYNGPAEHLDVPTAITVDDSGNVYVTGYSLGLTTGYDFATVRYGRTGQERWVVRFNGPADGLDMATAVAVDPRGNVYVTGYSCGAGKGDQYYDYATVKYNAQGEELWVAYFDGSAGGMDVAKAIAVDNRGNAYVTGYSCVEDADDGFCDFATVKYDARGREQWVAYYDGPGSGRDVPTSVSVDQRGNVYVTGYSCGVGIHHETCNFCTVKYGRHGNEQDVLVQDEAPAWDEMTHTTVIDRQGNVYVTTPSSDEAPPGRDYATKKQGRAPGLSEATMGLILQVQNLGLPGIVEFNLIRMLEGIIKSSAKGGERRAANQVQAFILELEAQRGKTLASEQVDPLINSAYEILDDIEHRYSPVAGSSKASRPYH